MNNLISKGILCMSLLGVTAYAKVYNKASFYIAYDSNDKTQYALVMPAVSKVYTHKAGDLTNLKLVSTQFASMPTYNNGTVCFPSLTSSADGSNGASKMASQCYETKFFYIQKDPVSVSGVNKTGFMLYYTTTQKLQEGFAGNSASFVSGVVRTGLTYDNTKSISGEDYSEFKFDITVPDIRLGIDACNGILNPITGECEVAVQNTAPTLTLNASTATVNTGAATTVEFSTADAQSNTVTVTGTTSNSAIATVTVNGTTATISGVAVGTATIALTPNDGTVNGTSQNITVTVTNGTQADPELPPQVPETSTGSGTTITPPGIPSL
jgi:hypothetical protein